MSHGAVPQPSAGQARLQRPPRAGARPHARAGKGNTPDMVGASVPSDPQENSVHPEGRWTGGQQRWQKQADGKWKGVFHGIKKW